MKKTNQKSRQVGYSWTILLSMAGVPILALLSKVFPNLNMLWAVLLIFCAVVFAYGIFGFLMPSWRTGSKKSAGAVAQAR